MSEMTYIRCAHCGADSRVSNSPPISLDGTLSLVSGLLLFQCQLCSVSYQLPFTTGAHNNETRPTSAEGEITG